jgi:protein-S-isoprenylcysteine O-methyltransferase Ste14
MPDARAPDRMLALRALFFVALLPGTVTVALPYWLWSSGLAARPLGLGALRVLGAPLLAVGVAVLSWCVWDFASAGRGTLAPVDPPQLLVTRGLYQRVRNPMYVGVISILLGEALLLDSRGLLVYAAAVWLGFHLFVLLYEEPHLRREFGASYDDYRRRVPRWVPRALAGKH